MNEYWDRMVIKVKIGLYAAFFFFVIIANFRGTINASEEYKGDDVEDCDCFWPPDMVPHPGLPEPAPNDGMASREQ